MDGLYVDSSIIRCMVSLFVYRLWIVYPNKAEGVTIKNSSLKKVITP